MLCWSLRRGQYPRDGQAGEAHRWTARIGRSPGGDAHPKSLVQSLEASLRRLEIDHIDLYWVHTWDAFTPIEEVVRLDHVVRAGKVLDVLEITPLGAQARRRRARDRERPLPPRLALPLARKDAELILMAAEADGADLPIGSAVRNLRAEADVAGWGDRDHSAINAHVSSSGRRGIG